MIDLSSHLKAGIILACFKESGKIPAIRELLNDLDKGTEILQMIDLMIFIEKSSKPIDLMFDRSLTIFSISTLVQGNKYIDNLLLYGI